MDPSIYEKPYFEAADMSKLLASIIDFMNHNVSLSYTNMAHEKITETVQKYLESKEASK